MKKPFLVGGLKVLRRGFHVVEVDVGKPTSAMDPLGQLVACPK